MLRDETLNPRVEDGILKLPLRGDDHAVDDGRIVYLRAVVVRFHPGEPKALLEELVQRDRAGAQGLEEGLVLSDGLCKRECGARCDDLEDG